MNDMDLTNKTKLLERFYMHLQVFDGYGIRTDEIKDRVINDFLKKEEHCNVLPSYPMTITQYYEAAQIEIPQIKEAKRNENSEPTNY